MRHIITTSLTLIFFMLAGAAGVGDCLRLCDNKFWRKTRPTLDEVNAEVAREADLSKSNPFGKILLQLRRHIFQPKDNPVLSRTGRKAWGWYSWYVKRHREQNAFAMLFIFHVGGLKMRLLWYRRWQISMPEIIPAIPLWCLRQKDKSPKLLIFCWMPGRMHSFAIAGSKLPFIMPEASQNGLTIFEPTDYWKRPAGSKLPTPLRD